MNDVPEFAIGALLDNYATTTLVNNTTATRTLTVPANRRWWLYAGRMKNGDSVARACDIRVVNVSAERIGQICYQSVAAGSVTSMFQTTASYLNMNSNVFPLKAGDAIEFVWNAGGASAGGTAESSAIVLEVAV